MNNVIVFSEKKVWENLKLGLPTYQNIPIVEMEMYKIYSLFKKNEQLFDGMEIVLDYKGLKFIGFKKQDVYMLTYEKKAINEANVRLTINGREKYKVNFKSEKELKNKAFKSIGESFFNHYYDIKTEKYI